jgi:hypothetical protein
MRFAAATDPLDSASVRTGSRVSTSRSPRAMSSMDDSKSA